MGKNIVPNNSVGHNKYKNKNGVPSDRPIVLHCPPPISGIIFSTHFSQAHRQTIAQMALTVLETGESTNRDPPPFFLDY